MFALLTAEKNFAHPWVGHARLNRLGLHPLRIAVADVIALLRRAGVGALFDATARRVMTDGVAVVPDLLAPSVFDAVRDEVHARMAEVEAGRPVTSCGDRGFGPRRPFDGGFDRWDGGTLNRFVRIDAHTPHTRTLANDLGVQGARAAGARPHPDKVWIYQTVNSGPVRNRDPQKKLHRDTFHSAIKLWYFIDEVRPADGPFEYVRGSHRMSAARLRWEQAEARRASGPGSQDPGGAFRVSPVELPSLGLPAACSYPVLGNTLVIADVRGFHRRGDSQPGTRRLALHASLRPSPFVPLPY